MIKILLPNQTCVLVTAGKVRETAGDQCDRGDWLRFALLIDDQISCRHKRYQQRFLVLTCYKSSLGSIITFDRHFSVGPGAARSSLDDVLYQPFPDQELPAKK